MLRQQLISAAKITAINEATTDLEKLQVCRSENELANFYRKSGEKNVSRLSSKSFRTLFSKDFMYYNVRENEQKFIKQNFETMREYTLNN